MALASTSTAGRSRPPAGGGLTALKSGGSPGRRVGSGICRLRRGESAMGVPTLRRRTSEVPHLDRALGAILLVGAANGGPRLLPLFVRPAAQGAESAAAGLVAGAVDGDGLAVDVFGAGPQQQDGEVAQLGHLADPAHGIAGA